MLFLDTSIRNAQAEAVRLAAVNGYINVKSGTGQTLVHLLMGGAPFNPASSGGVSLVSMLSAVATLAGKASYFELFRSDNSLILRGTVGNNAGDIVLSSVNIRLGDTVQLTALSYYTPAA